MVDKDTMFLPPYPAPGATLCFGTKDGPDPAQGAAVILHATVRDYTLTLEIQFDPDVPDNVRNSGPSEIVYELRDDRWPYPTTHVLDGGQSNG